MGKSRIRIDTSLLDEIKNIKFDVMKNLGVTISDADASKLLMYRLKKTGGTILINKKRKSTQGIVIIK